MWEKEGQACSIYIHIYIYIHMYMSNDEKKRNGEKGDLKNH